MRHLQVYIVRVLIYIVFEDVLLGSEETKTCAISFLYITFVVTLVCYNLDSVFTSRKEAITALPMELPTLLQNVTVEELLILKIAMLLLNLVILKKMHYI